MKKIYIYSRGKFLELSNEFLQDKAIIRIHNPKDYKWYKSEEIKESVLEVFFDDLNSKQLSWLDKLKAILNIAINSDKNIQPLTKKQAIEILKFIQKNINKKDFIIHCEFGRSRSVAVAIFLKDYYNYTIINKENRDLVNANSWVIHLLKKFNKII